jgi:hypothetical protein
MESPRAVNAREGRNLRSTTNCRHSVARYREVRAVSGGALSRLGRWAHIACNGVQQAVHEFWLLALEKGVRNGHVFVEDDLDRQIDVRQQLMDPGPQDGPARRIEAL